MRSENFPIPNIMHMLDLVSNAKYLTLFNLVKGYHQIGLMECMKKISAFTVEDGNYQYERMPFGLVAASFTCQKLMTQIFVKLSKFVVVYIDDILVFDNELEEHFDHVE